MITLLLALNILGLYGLGTGYFTTCEFSINRLRNSLEPREYTIVVLIWRLLILFFISLLTLPIFISLLMANSLFFYSILVALTIISIIELPFSLDNQLININITLVKLGQAFKFCLFAIAGLIVVTIGISAYFIGLAITYCSRKLKK